MSSSEREIERVFRAYLRLFEDPSTTREALAAVLTDDCNYMRDTRILATPEA